MCRETITLPVRCSRCGDSATVSNTHWINGEGVRRFAEEFRCAHCGALATSDGIEPPESVRKALIERDGLWCVRVAGLGARPVDVVRFIRDRFGLSLGDALAMATDPSRPLRLGTFVELSEISLRLEDLGATARVERSGGASDGR